MRIDVNTFIGSYPFRDVPGSSPIELLRAMDRCAIGTAWVSNLPALFWRDPTPGNDALFKAASETPRLKAVPTIAPELAGWELRLVDAKERGAPAVRAAPHLSGSDPVGAAMHALVAACGANALPLIMAVRLEDGRQRHPVDGSAELSPAAVRTLIRSNPSAKLIITHADRDFVEQVHFGATPQESVRILWDISWIWGPPEDHLELLLSTVGPERFTFGTGMPMRLPENALAKLELLESPEVCAAALGYQNLAHFLRES